MEQRKKNLRCTRAQIQFLQRYMANNKTIANPTGIKSTSISTLEANRRAQEWCTLRALLRRHGPDKSVQKWKQTWRDLKKKLNKEKLEAAKGIKVESYAKEEIEKKCYTAIINNSDTIHETSIEYDDPLQSTGAGGAFIKEEPSVSPVESELLSIDINLDTPCSSPMQVVLTNTETFISNSTSTSTQTSCKPSSGFTHSSNPPCISRKPPVCSCTSNPPSVCSCTSKPPFICVDGNFSSPAIHSHGNTCCGQNVPLDVPGTNNIHNQQNALLQRLCNLLEEQNSNLRIRNRIERNKMRFQFFRRF